MKGHRSPETVETNRHVIALKRDLDHSPTIVAALPALPLGYLKDSLRLLIFGTVTVMSSCFGDRTGCFAARGTDSTVAVDSAGVDGSEQLGLEQ